MADADSSHPYVSKSLLLFPWPHRSLGVLRDPLLRGHMRAGDKGPPDRQTSGGGGAVGVSSPPQHQPPAGLAQKLPSLDWLMGTGNFLDC